MGRVTLAFEDEVIQYFQMLQRLARIKITTFSYHILRRVVEYSLKPVRIDANESPLR